MSSSKATTDRSSAPAPMLERNDRSNCFSCVIDSNTMSYISSYLTEDDVYHLENAYPCEKVVRQGTIHQWKKFYRHDCTRDNSNCGHNHIVRRWRPPITIERAFKNQERFRAKNCQDQCSKYRLQGRDFVYYSIAADRISQKARNIYDFNQTIQGRVGETMTIPFQDDRPKIGEKYMSGPLDHRQFYSWKGMEKLYNDLLNQAHLTESPHLALDPSNQVQKHSKVYVFVHLELMDGSNRKWSAFRPMKLWDQKYLSGNMEYGAKIKLRWKYINKALDWKEGEEVYQKMLLERRIHQLRRQTIPELIKNVQITILYSGCHVISTGGFYKTTLSGTPLCPAALFHPRLANCPLTRDGPFTHRYEVGIHFNARKDQLILGLLKYQKSETSGT